MTAIHNAYINALLADASYVDDLQPGDTASGLARVLTGRMTPVLAQYIGDNFTVLAQVGGLTSSFDATVWRENSTGNIFVSMRGTQEGVDYFQDADLATTGLPYEQLRDMVNWWLRETTTGLAPQIDIQTTVIPQPLPLPPLVLRDFVAAAPLQGTGTLIDIGTIKSVNGHSLGGYLATAFARLFGQRWPIERVNTFNSAGFSRVASANIEDGFGQIAQVIGPALGLGAFVAPQNNYFASNGINVATNTWDPIGFAQYGERIGIFQEDGVKEVRELGISNHFIYKLTDVLSLGDVLEIVDPAFDLMRLSALVGASSNQMAASYEGLLDAFRSLFLGPDVIATSVGDDGGDSAGPQRQSRVDYHANLGKLRSAIDTVPRTVTIADLTSMSASDLLTRGQAPNGLAYRYALKELNPFAVLGPDSLYDGSGAIPSHNARGELSLYVGAASAPAGMTASYIGDRAVFLQWKTRANVADVTSQIDGSSGESWKYVDRPQNYLVTVSGGPTTPSSPARLASFGGDNADGLQGGLANDHLYGSAGVDLLQGGPGNDYLEGGAGLDLYEYDAARSLLGDLTNDGADEIRDTDGQGVIRYTYTQTNIGPNTVQSRLVGGIGVKIDDTHWQSPDGKFTYSQYFDGSLGVTINGDAGGTITLDDFDFARARAGGSMGIRLVDAMPGAPQDPVRTFLGDKEDWDSNPATTDVIDRVDDGYGNTVRADGQDGRPDIADPDRVDVFSGSALDEVEHFHTAGGNDQVNADGPNSVTSTAGGRDLVETGAGRDVLAAGGNADWVEGGADGDILAGNAGDDVLYADTSNGRTLTLAQAIVAGESALRSGDKGDLLTGDSGRDVLIGATTDELLTGGAGEDIIVGGAGDDTIYGDSGVSESALDWNAVRSVTVNASTALYLVTAQNYTLTADPATDGADVIYGGAGADWVFAGGGNDYVQGGNTASDANVDDDVIFGNAGNDILVGGSGKDVISGDSPQDDSAGLSGDDYLDGGMGDDRLFGNKGNDILVGGEGADTLVGGEGADLLWGGPGGDTLIGGPGKDTYIFNRGDGREDVYDTSDTASVADASVVVMGSDIVRDQIKYWPGSLVIDAGDGDEIHFNGFNPDDPLSTPVIDSIQFADGSSMSYQDILDQGFDIVGTEGDDVIDGTAVTDRINGKGGNDAITGKAGDDTILGGEGDDAIDAGPGNDVVDAGPGNDTLHGGEGDDNLQGGDGVDALDGGDGDDTLLGGAGDDTFSGGPGNDVIDAGDGADLLEGGAGDDVLNGGAGTDSYLLYGGMGQETATDGEAGETNVLQLGAGLALENLYAVQAGDDLRIGFRGLEDALTLKDYFTRTQDWVARDFGGNDTPLDTVLATPDPYAGDLVAQLWRDAKLGQVARSVGAAYQIGWTPAGDALFQGFLSRAWIAHDAQTTLETFTRTSPPYDVLSSNTTQSVDDRLLAFEGQTGSRFQLPLFGLETGSAASDASVIYGAGLSLPSTVTSGQAILTLSGQLPLLNVQSTQYSNSGSVVGYDTGTEIVSANVTYDYDVLHYNQSATVRNVTEDTSGWTAAVDQIVENRVLVDMTKSESRYLNVNEIFAGASDNLIYSGSGSYGTFGLTTLVDGGAGDDTVYGRSGDLLYGNSGSDTLTASGATLIGGDGSDTLAGEGDSRFVFTATEVGLDKVSETATYSDQYLGWFYTAQGIADWRESSEHGGQYYVDGEGRWYFDSLAEAQAFFPGWEIGYVEPLPFGAPVVRRDDAASISALAQGGVMPLDIVQFGPGVSLADLELRLSVPGEVADAHPDLPSYGGGTLSVRWGSGAGFYVGVPDVQYGFTGSQITADPAGAYRLGESVELFRFADGNTYTLDQVLQQAALVKLYGYPFLRGSGSQVIDPIWGGVAFAGDVDPSEVTAEQVGTDLVFRLTDGSAEGRIAGWYADPAAVPPMSFSFGDGTVLDADAVTRLSLTQYGSEGNDFLEADPSFASALHGLDGNDFLDGGDGNDLLDGGPGDDDLWGGAGNDIYAFGAGYGTDSINEDGAGGSDVVRFDAGVAPQDVTVSQNRGALVVTLGAGGDQLTLQNWLYTQGGSVEALQFADGTVWDGAAIAAMLPAPVATEGDNLIYGTWGDDVLDGLGGNDELYDFYGHDTLYGGGGDDYIEANDGNDLLFGGDGADDLEVWRGAGNFVDAGPGDDYLYAEGASFIAGGAGDDWIDAYGAGSLIAFNPGDGNDTVYAVGTFTLSIGGGVLPSDLSLGQDGTDLLIDVAGTDSIRLTRQWDADPTAWPAITLQMFGSVHEYDFNAVIADYEAQAAGDPNFVLPLGAVLAAHEVTTSQTDAIGGAIAWRYATAGGAGLSVDELRTVLADPGFGFAPQPIALAAAADHVPIAHDDTGAAREDGGPVILPAVALVANDTDSDAGDTKTIIGVTDSDAGAAVRVADGDVVYDPGNLFQDLGEGATVVDSFGYTIADSAGATAEARVAMTISGANDAPVLAEPIGSKTGRERQAFALALPSGTFSDIDEGDSLTYSAALAEGKTLPAWLGFDATSAAFAGTPGLADGGEYLVRVTAADSSGATASTEFSLTVLDSFADGERIVGAKGDDVLNGTSADELLDGGRGDDLLSGGAGADAYMYERGGGDDVIVEAGRGSEIDVLRFGAGVRANMLSVRRLSDDLVLDLKDGHGSVTMRGWFGADEARVERVEFADGKSWDEATIRAHARSEDACAGGPPFHHGHDDDNEPRHSSSDKGHPKAGHDKADDRACDAARGRLAKAARFDFDALLRDLGQGAPETSRPRDELRRQWLAVAGYASALEDPADDAHGVLWRGASDWPLLAAASAPQGFGFEASVAASRGPEGLKSLEGLREGFARL